MAQVKNKPKVDHAVVFGPSNSGLTSNRPRDGVRREIGGALWAGC
jgi:hypothetical protein